MTSRRQFGYLVLQQLLNAGEGPVYMNWYTYTLAIRGAEPYCLEDDYRSYRRALKTGEESPSLWKRGGVPEKPGPHRTN